MSDVVIDPASVDTGWNLRDQFLRGVRELAVIVQLADAGDPRVDEPLMPLL